MDLALFDFDGTITNDDSFTGFVLFATPMLRLLRGSVRLSAEIAAYEIGALPASRLRAAMAQQAFGGRSQRELGALGERFAARRLPRIVRPRALGRIARHQALGDRVVVVSASLSLYLAPFCASLGIELVCTELEVVAGTATGKYRGGDCTGSEKALRVRTRYDPGDYRNVYAYGDSDEDRELLALATRPFFRWPALED